jgi:hypothetical protein
MKTIMKIEVEETEPASSYIRRINDLSAVKLVKEGAWQYIPKALWKEKVRDVNKKEDSSKKKKRSKKDE